MAKALPGRNTFLFIEALTQGPFETRLRSRLRSCFNCQGERYAKTGSPSLRHGALARQRTTDFSDAPSNDGKAQAGARGLGGKEWLKDFGPQLGGDAGAGILHIDFQAVAVAHQADPRPTAIGLRLNGIDDQIRKYFA